MLLLQANEWPDDTQWPLYTWEYVYVTAGLKGRTQTHPAATHLPLATRKTQETEVKTQSFIPYMCFLQQTCHNWHHNPYLSLLYELHTVKDALWNHKLISNQLEVFLSANLSQLVKIVAQQL